MIPSPGLLSSLFFFVAEEASFSWSAEAVCSANDF